MCALSTVQCEVLYSLKDLSLDLIDLQILICKYAVMQYALQS